MDNNLVYFIFTFYIGEGKGTPLQCPCLENPGQEPDGLPSMQWTEPDTTTEATWQQQQQRNAANPEEKQMPFKERAQNLLFPEHTPRRPRENCEK